MRTAVVFLCSLAMLACMKKQADGTYRATNPVVTDAAKAHDNAAKAGDEVNKAVESLSKSDAVQKIKAGSKELGKGVEEGVGHAAQVAGAKLQHVGKKAENSAKH